MENQKTDWVAGDSCFLIVSTSRRYVQEFEVQGFDGNYYSVKRGKYLHHVDPSRMFRTKDEALISLDTIKIQASRNASIMGSENEKEKPDMNEYERLRRLAERHRETYPPGTRLELIDMNDPYAPMPAGTRGTVQYVDDIGQIGMKWDNGRSLSIVPSKDSFRKLTEEELAEEQNDGMDEDSSPVMGM